MLKGLDRLPLATGVGAFGLQHVEPAVAFAVVLALAVILGRLAIALALTAIHTEAAALERLGVGRGDERRAGNDQGGGGHGDLSTGFFRELHLPLLSHEL